MFSSASFPLLPQGGSTLPLTSLGTESKSCSTSKLDGACVISKIFSWRIKSILIVWRGVGLFDTSPGSFHVNPGGPLSGSLRIGKTFFVLRIQRTYRITKEHCKRWGNVIATSHHGLTISRHASNAQILWRIYQTQDLSIEAIQHFKNDVFKYRPCIHIDALNVCFGGANCTILSLNLNIREDSVGRTADSRVCFVEVLVF